MKKHRLYRLKKKITQIFFLFSIFYSLSSLCYAQPLSSNELIERAKDYNNQVVEYQGEVVGDVMPRGEFAWVNINDGQNAIGVWGKRAIINSVVNRKGDYNCKGDIVLIRGVFHRACPDHGGDLDIHMDNIVKLEEGFATPHPMQFPKFAQAFGLSIVALCICMLYAFKAGIKPWKKK